MAVSAALFSAAGPSSPWPSRRAGRRGGPPPALTGSGLTQWGGDGPAQGGGGGANRLVALVDVCVGGGGCSPFSPVLGGAGGGRRYAQPAARCSRGRRGGGAADAWGGGAQARPGRAGLGLAGASRAAIVPLSAPLRDTAMREARASPVAGPQPPGSRRALGLPWAPAGSAVEWGEACVEKEETGVSPPQLALGVAPRAAGGPAGGPRDSARPEGKAGRVATFLAGGSGPCGPARVAPGGAVRWRPAALAGALLRAGERPPHFCARPWQLCARGELSGIMAEGRALSAAACAEAAAGGRLGSAPRRGPPLSGAVAAAAEPPWR